MSKSIGKILDMYTSGEWSKEDTVAALQRNRNHTVKKMTQLPTDKELREQLAAIEHERWADWQKWCHKVLREQLRFNDMESNLEEILSRWERQIATPYSELSEAEKASDMEQVDRYWYLFAAQRQKDLKAIAWFLPVPMKELEKWVEYGAPDDDDIPIPDSVGGD